MRVYAMYITKAQGQIEGGWMDGWTDFTDPQCTSYLGKAADGAADGCTVACNDASVH